MKNCIKWKREKEKENKKSIRQSFEQLISTKKPKAKASIYILPISSGS